MIRMPKEVKDIIKTLKDRGFGAYAAGLCVRDSLAGDKPVDWDIITDAGLDKITELFPEGKTVSEKLSVVRLYGNESEDQEQIITDICTYRKKTAPGEVSFSEDVRDDLRIRDFTVNAMADSGYEFIDDFGGRSAGAGDSAPDQRRTDEADQR